jgi:hypothetical protein
MKGTDKILIGIVAGVILLVAVAFAVTLARPEPTFQDEDAAEGVAFNYLFALQKEDYDRAYGYLSVGLPGRPDSVGEFEDNIETYSWRFREDTNTTLTIQSTSREGMRAVVVVQETTFYGGDIFDTSQRISTFEMDLHLVGGDWVIEDGDNYFVRCWKDDDGCN